MMRQNNFSNSHLCHDAGCEFFFGTICPKVLYKSVWIVEVVIVEDVLVLFCERLGGHIHFVHLTSLGQTGPPAAVYQPVEVKGVFLVGLSRKLVVGVLLQIVLAGIERGAGPGAARCTDHRASWQARWGSSAPGPAAATRWW